MINKEILKAGMTGELNQDDKLYIRSIYRNLKNSFDLIVKNKIVELNNKFNSNATYHFNLEKDFKSRNTDIIISYSTHRYHLNLFYFEIKIDDYSKAIEDYILNDNILQLATIRDSHNSICLDLKENILKELNCISAKMNHKALFNILSNISIYDPYDYNNGGPLIQIHFERCMTSDKILFDSLLNIFQSNNMSEMTYITNEIIFGSHLKNILTHEQFEVIKTIRDKMDHAVFYSNIKDVELKEKLQKNINTASFFENTEGFGFNNA